MGVGLFLLILLGVGVVLGVVAVVGSALTPERQSIRDANTRAASAEARAKIGAKALRAIANGAGNPIFEAQDALDNMESTYTKELN